MEEPQSLKSTPDLTGVDLKQFSSDYQEYLAIGNLPEDRWDAAIGKLLEKVRWQHQDAPQN